MIQTLAIVSLLGLSQASVPMLRPIKELVQTGLDSEQDHTSHWNTYTVLQVSPVSIQDVTAFWEKREDGARCLDIFNQIVTKIGQINTLITEVNGLIEEYNTGCSDKCLDGFVKCGPVCKKNSECCIDNGLLECATNNHGPDVTPDDTEAVCVEWCCQDDQYFCENVCTSVNLPPVNGEITIPDGKDFPKTCCIEDECCTTPDSWNQNTLPAQCCTQGSKIDDFPVGNPIHQGLLQGCCGAGEHWCPDIEDHCQSIADNRHCCDTGFKWCEEQKACINENWECCLQPLTNCPTQDGACTTADECCPGDDKWCVHQDKCIPNAELCCAPDETKCTINGVEVCWADPHCCLEDEQFCPLAVFVDANGATVKGQCRPDNIPCCDETKGESWCEGENKCLVVVPDGRQCCDAEFFWCDISMECEADGTLCETPVPCPWDPKLTTLDQECCNADAGLFWCPEKMKCLVVEACCPIDGETKCKLASDADNACYGPDVCCEQKGGFWCQHSETCSTKEECCNTQKDLNGVQTHLWLPDFGQCCETGSNNFIDEANSGSGCCNKAALPQDDTYCCADGFQFDAILNKCDFICPCEGCCDFNCCDQVDYFMHRAWKEVYEQGGDFLDYQDFYAKWNIDFEDWWKNGNVV